MALSVGVACWVLLRTPTEPSPGPAPAASAAEAAGSSAKQDELERRLQRLEAALAVATNARHEAVPVAVPEPVAGDAASTPSLEQRLAAVERLLQQVRSEQLAIGPMPTTLGGIVKALADKNLYGPDATPELRQRRMDLRRRLLEIAPGDPQAGKVLLELANDSLGMHGARTALEVLDQFAGRTNVDATQLARAYANFHSQAGDGDRARSYYDSILRDTALTESERASTRFWHAHSFYQQQRYDEGARAFQALIDSYGDNPPAGVRNTLEGARNYLQKCRELK